MQSFGWIRSNTKIFFVLTFSKSVKVKTTQQQQQKTESQQLSTMKLVTALLNFFALSVAIVHPVLGEDDACEGSLMDSMVMPTKAKMRKNAPKPNEARDKALNYTRFTRQRGELVCDPDTGKDPTGTFECKNMNLAAFISGDELGSDFSNNNFIYTSEVWGYVDRRGKEFALVGMWDGVSIVDISVPHKPCVRAFVPTTPEGVLRGDGQYWRDIKVVGDVAYIAADRINNHGIQVVDLTRLENMRCNRGNRGLGEVPKLFPDYIDYDGEWAHNLAVAPSNKITHAPSAHKLIGMGMRGKDPLCPRDGLGRLASLKIYDISGSNALMPKFEDCYYSDAQYVHE